MQAEKKPFGSRVVAKWELPKDEDSLEKRLPETFKRLVFRLRSEHLFITQ